MRLCRRIRNFIRGERKVRRLLASQLSPNKSTGNDEGSFSYLAKAMREKRIKPEIEVFDTAMLETGLKMMQKDLLEPPLHIDLVMGVPGGIAATERNLRFLVETIPTNATWSVAAIGRHEFPMARLAIEMGGHVRVGMEDNIFLEKGVLAQSNAQLVEKVVAMARELNRPIATLKQAREMLHLNFREA